MSQKRLKGAGISERREEKKKKFLKNGKVAKESRLRFQINRT